MILLVGCRCQTKVYCMVLYDWLGIMGIVIFVVSAGLLFEVVARVSGRAVDRSRHDPAD